MRKLTGRAPKDRSKVSTGVIKDWSHSGTSSGLPSKRSKSKYTSRWRWVAAWWFPTPRTCGGRDGIEVVARSTFVFTVENGLQTRIQMFQERADALEAAGLSE